MQCLLIRLLGLIKCQLESLKTACRLYSLLLSQSSMLLFHLQHSQGSGKQPKSHLFPNKAITNFLTITDQSRYYLRCQRMKKNMIGVCVILLAVLFDVSYGLSLCHQGCENDNLDCIDFFCGQGNEPECLQCSTVFAECVQGCQG